MTKVFDYLDHFLSKASTFSDLEYWYISSQHLAFCRLHMCQTGQGSAGVREFVKSQYAKMKTANPGFPFLIREAEGTSAAMTARYGMALVPCLTGMSHRFLRHRNLEMCTTLMFWLIGADLGVEKSVSLEGKTASQVLSELEGLVKAGSSMKK